MPKSKKHPSNFQLYIICFNGQAVSLAVAVRALHDAVTDFWGEDDGADVLTSPFESIGSFAWLINDAMLIKVKNSILPKSELSIPNWFTKVLASIVDTYQ